MAEVGYGSYVPDPRLLLWGYQARLRHCPLIGVRNMSLEGWITSNRTHRSLDWSGSISVNGYAVRAELQS
jgi:hypothetical protein